MSAKRGGRLDPDARATRRASLVIGWQIVLASAALVVGIVVVTLVFLLHQAIPREQIEQLRSSDPRVYVDTADVLQALVVIGVGAVVFAGVISWVIARRAVRPLGEALRLQRQFVADASHELRTPLAVLDARLQVLQRRLTQGDPQDPGGTARTVAELRADSRSLIDIVNDLLLAADATVTTEPAPALEAGPVIAEAVDSLRILARDKGVRLVLETRGEGSVRLGATSLRRSVVALVDNAISHSPGEGTVRIVVSRLDGFLELTVVDEGPGIVGIAPERVFERFARAEAAAETPSARKSFGIGLALVRDIVERQGGRVQVVETSPTGTSMRLSLPIAR
jgi:two-component system OmpR family sensor kinase